MVDLFDPDKIDFAEAAKLLHKHVRTLHDWRERGLPCVKVGGRWMTTKDSIRKWLEEEFDTDE